MASDRSWQRVDKALLAAAAVSLVVAVVLVAKDSRLLFGAAHAHGDVVAIERPGTLGAALIAPVIRFRAGQDVHVFRARPSNMPWQVGDDVDVIYDPGDPSRASAEDLLSLWMPAFAALGAAVVFGGVGAALYFALEDAG